MTARQRFAANRPAAIGLAALFFIGAACVTSLPWSLGQYDATHLTLARKPPGGEFPLGTDLLGRSLAARTLLGGAISLGVAAAAAMISVVIGVAWGLTAGWLGGQTDRAMMRMVDVLYGLPYLLLVILIRVAVAEGPLRHVIDNPRVLNMVVLLISISAVSWLTMARVIRGQVLSLRTRPFVESARVLGLPGWRIALSHLLPNLVGPIVVYAALTVPQAILQESFLSFLGIGIERPLPSWGNLAADGVTAVNTIESFWWMLLFPCGLLTATLLALNAVGDGLRDAFDLRAA